MLSKIIRGSSANAFTPLELPTVSESPRPAAPRAVAAAESAETGALVAAQQAALVERTKREAFEAGLARGREEAHAEVTPVIERLKASIAEVVALRPDLRRKAEADAVRLSLLIARRVLHRELQVDENALNALARVVFDRLARSDSWVLTVHPRFVAAIEQGVPSAALHRVRVESDPSCAPGTMIVRSPEGTIDASIESQLEEIGHGLTDRLALA